MYGPERIQLRTRNSEAAEKAQVVWGTQYPDANSNTFESSQKDLREKINETENEVRAPKYEQVYGAVSDIIHSRVR